MKEMSDLICGKAAVGGNYNSTRDNKSVIKNLLPDSLKSTIEFLPLLDVGEALVVGDSILLPSKIALDKPLESHRPISATKAFWDEWDNNEPDNSALIEAVEALRKQCR